MKHNEQSFPMSNLLCGRIKEFWQEEVFDEYSDNHSDKAIFEVLAEIYVFAHFLAFAKDQVTLVEYEPCLIENSHHNPEARIK